MINYKLGVLGSFQIETAGSPIKLPQHKVRALLTYLVVEQQQHDRSEIAEMFWPDKAPDKARLSLRVALSSIAKALQLEGVDIIIRTGTKLQFNRELPLQTDLHEFLGCTADVSTEKQLATVNATLTLWRGDFLEDLVIPECDAFNAWLEQWRLRLRQHARKLSGKAEGFYRQQDDLPKILQLLHQQLTISPHDESIHREYMQTLLVLGRNAEACEHYEQLSRYLQLEFNIAPQDETTELYRSFSAGKATCKQQSTESFRPITALYARYSVGKGHDAEYRAALLRSLSDELSTRAAENGGHVLRMHAGGMMVYFGYPTGHEDDVQTAVTTALQLQRIADAAEGWIGIGIHTGIVLADPSMPDQTDMLTGTAMELVVANSSSGVVISPETAEIVASQFRLVTEQGQRIRVEAQSGSEVLAQAQLVLAPFIGRSKELEQLRSLWTQRQGKSVLITAEPGLGKSRLVHEFIQQLPAGTQLIEIHCSDRSTSHPFQPLVELFERMAGVEIDETTDTRIDKIRDLFGGKVWKTQQRYAALEQLLNTGSEPEGPVRIGFGQNLFVALQGFLRYLRTKGRLLIVIEDLQWMDPSTMEILRDYLRKPSSGMLLCTARSEFIPQQLLGLDQHISLTRLEPDEILSMIEALTGATQNAQMQQHLVARSEGVPLFIEELSRVVMEPGFVGKELPARLTGLLNARLDSLGYARTVAQAASVLGREFHRSWLDQDEETESALLRLKKYGFIEHYPTAEHLRFRHTLYQEVAYASLPTTQRRERHYQAAIKLEKLGYKHPEKLAWHYSEGGDARRSACWWLEAGRQAMNKGALMESHGHLQNGWQQAQSLPAAMREIQLELDMNVALGTVLFMLEGFGSQAACACFDHASLKLETNTSDTHRFAVHWGTWLGSSTRWGYAAGLDQARQLIVLSSKAGHPGLQALACWAMGNNQFFLGELESAASYLARTMTHYNDHGGKCPPIDTIDDAGVMATAFLSWNAWLLGDEVTAMEAQQASFSLAGEQPGPLSYALCFAAYLARMRGDVATTRQFAERLLAHGREYNLALWVASGQALCGWAEVRSHGEVVGIAQIHEAIGLIQHVMPSIALTYQSMLADAYGATGDYRAQQAAAEQAIAMIETHQERFLAAELYCLLGDACAAQGLHQQAKDAWQTALGIARRQGAIPFEQRALDSLASQDGKSLPALAIEVLGVSG